MATLTSPAIVAPSVRVAALHGRRGTFQEAYCAAYRCPPARFGADFLWSMLRGRARLLWLWDRSTGGRFFEADRELIGWLGSARDRAHALEMLTDYRRDPRNSTWLRGRLKLRISTERVQKVVRQVWPE